MKEKNLLHIGIIMDGNGRWATQQGKERLEGHARGVEVVREIVQVAPSMNIHTITLFAFAIANWKRDKKEVDGLWELFTIFLEKTSKEMLAQGVRIVCIGNKKGLPQHVQKLVHTIEHDSKDNNDFLLQIALNYDGIDEVARLIQRTIENNVSADEVTAEYVRTHLDTEAGNEPDIVLRTGLPVGESGMSLWRSSSFLPLQSVQSVCVSTPVLWPDFTAAHLQEIIQYAKPEERLFGGQR